MGSNKRINTAITDSPIKKTGNISLIFSIILVSLFLSFIAILTTTKIFIDNDVFWHLATGKYIAENLSIPSTDIFGFVTSGMYWIPFEWGWDVINYLLFKAGDYTLVSIFRSIIIIIIFITALRFAKKLNIPVILTVLIGIILCFGMLVRFGERPYLISYLFITVLIAILISVRQSGYKSIKLLCILPFMFLIWANMHMGVVLGIGIFIIFIASEYLNTKINKKAPSPDFKKLIIFFLLSAGTLLINPFFINTFIYAYSHTQMDSLENINEWRSPFSKGVADFYYVKIYLFFLIAGASTIYYLFKKKEVFPALLYLAFGIYSLYALRYTADYMVIIFIPLLLSVNCIASGLFKNKSTGFPFVSVIAKSILSVLLIYLIVIIYNGTLYKDILDNRFRETGFGVNEKYYSAGMMDFIKKEKINSIASKPFNNLRFGGYIIWELPGTKNFIDSRNLNDDIMKEYSLIDQKKPGFEDKLKYYGIDCVLYCIPYMTESSPEIERNLTAYLFKSPAWKLIFWDDKSLFFVKDEPKFKEIIEKFEYRYLTPANIIFNKKILYDAIQNDKERFLNEINRKKSNEKNGKLINSVINEMKLQ